MSRYISQKQAHEERAKLKATRSQLRVALAALAEISKGYECESCGGTHVECPKVIAETALQTIKEIST